MPADDANDGETLLARTQKLLGKLPNIPEQLLKAVARELAISEEVFPASEGSTLPVFLKTVKARADTRQVTVPDSHRPVVGKSVTLAKRLAGRAVQPLVNEVLRRQVEYNEAILEALAQLYGYLQEQAGAARVWRRDLDKRIAQLEEAQRQRVGKLSSIDGVRGE